MTHKHSVYDTDARFSITPATRAIRNVSAQKTTVIQNDHNSERFTFEIPRFIDGHDMAACDKAEVHYINIDSAAKKQSTGIYVMDDLQTSPDNEDYLPRKAQKPSATFSSY